VLGLVDAVAKFDTAKRVKLESYARHRVRGAILDGLRGADPVSRDMRRKNKRIQLLYRELEVKLGRPVTDEEMAAAVGISLANWYRTLREVQSVGFDFGIRPFLPVRLRNGCRPSDASGRSRSEPLRVVLPPRATRDLDPRAFTPAGAGAGDPDVLLLRGADNEADR